MNILLGCILVFSALCELYIIFSLFVNKKNYRKNEIKKIPNKWYIIIIVIIIVLFAAYGILRNFV